ncbi:MAG: ATP-dependent Clp protease proteolytic subunit [Candidatus Pacebacteria bacterium]|nr:ATP-dependent Clp protease proteolytic subunit [Candidatus Paceibacterota bacterium]MDD5621108.1 ATP-dependent Clp protease proteolytic subunit [Candidatus Paceibacterota bacterium]
MIKEKTNQIVAKHTGQKLDKVEKDADRDFYLFAQEGKKYGIVDEVIGEKI